MVRRWPARVLVPAFILAAVLAASGPGVSAQAARAVDESFFAEKVYPVLHAAQCERCHSDNGVASETRLEFPEPDAGRDRITAFGLSLMDLVDRRDPERSLLLRKPTKRIKHSGGQRIKPGSGDEAVLLGWINYLAGLSDEQVRRARERIARSDRRGLEALAVRRLTHSQYNHTVRDLLGEQSQPAGGFPKEDFVNGFKNQLEGAGDLAAPGGSLRQGGRATRPRGLPGRRPARIDPPPARSRRPMPRPSTRSSGGSASGRSDAP